MDDDLASRLLLHARGRLDRHGEALPAPLDRVYADVRDEWLDKIGGGGAEELFLGPWGTPAFPLLAWVAEGCLDPTDGQPARDAAEAMLAWYLALRCQDDVVDEDAPAERIYLEQALAAHAVGLLVQAAGDAGQMLAVWSRVTTDFAAYALHDARLQARSDSTWSEADLAKQGRKYLPMAAPPAALLIRAGRADQVDRLIDALVRMATGLQLTNDLRGVRRDLAAGLASPYTAAVGLQPGLHAEADAAPALRRAVRTGAWDGYVERIERALRDGVSALPELPGERMATHLGERLEVLSHHRASMILKAELHAPALVADVELTRRCDLACPQCFVRAQEDAAAELPWGMLEEILEELSGYDTTLHLTGGEPFTHPDIWRVLQRAAELGLRRAVINTHGAALDDDALMRLGALAIPVKLLVSLDGPPGVHDRTRGAHVTKAALRVLRRAPDCGVDATPGTLLTRELVDHGIGAWHAWLAGQLGTRRRLALWPVFLRPEQGALPAAGITPLSPEALVEAARQVAGCIAAGADMTVVDYPPINPLLARLGVPERRLWRCTGGASRLCVQADGTVTPCHPLRWELDRLSPGRVGGTVARALAHADARRMAAREHDGCEECAELALCGSCQAVVWGSSGSRFRRDPGCAEAIERLATPRDLHSV